MPAKKTTKEFVKDARKVHGDRYDYSRVRYRNSRDRVTIVCRVHGEFCQQPTSHVSGKGCLLCGGRQKLTDTEFRKRFKEMHGDSYGYEKSDFLGVDKKIVITCKAHGDFEMKPSEHLRGWGCTVCQFEKRKPRLLSEWLEKARKQHGDLYNYDKVAFVDNREKVIVTCKKHGDFRQVSSHHVRGRGCPRCQGCISKPSIEWLEAMAVLDRTHIQHGRNGGEVLVKGTRFHADGYSEELHKVYDFLGTC